MDKIITKDGKEIITIPAIMECPNCKGLVHMGSKSVWSGKNLKCLNCNEYAYYDEFITVKDTESYINE